MSFVQVAARITRGHRVASGQGGDPRFPDGTIRPQLPWLMAAVPGFKTWLGGPAYPGTLNLDVIGHHVLAGKPDHRVAAVRWTSHFDPETFLLSRAKVTVGGAEHPAYLYMPDPATKPDHHQPASVVEVLAAYIPGLCYGLPATLHYPPAALRLVPTA